MKSSLEMILEHHAVMHLNSHVLMLDLDGETLQLVPNLVCDVYFVVSHVVVVVGHLSVVTST